MLVVSTCWHCSGDANEHELSLAADVCLTTPVHLAQIAMDHVFSGRYSIVVKQFGGAAKCDISSDDSCAKWSTCGDGNVRVINAACGPIAEVEWRDLDIPWKIVINQATQDPIHLAVFRDTSLLWQGSVELTFPGPTDCDFSPYAVTPEF